MKITSTSENKEKVKGITMLVYGDPGVGKTTFASTAPNPVIADCENGTKFFGPQGITLDVGHIKKWEDVREFYKLVIDSDYETVIIDPLSALSEIAVDHLSGGTGNKGMNIQKWGELKTMLRDFVKSFRAADKNLLLISHVQEEKDDSQKIFKRPKMVSKVWEDITAMMDIVAVFRKLDTQDENGTLVEKRFLSVVTENEKYIAKDRTGALNTPETNGYIEPDFNKVLERITDGMKKKEQESSSESSTSKKETNKTKKDSGKVSPPPFNKQTP